MTNGEIVNEIKSILSELNNGEDAVSYLTQSDMKWLNENIKALEPRKGHWIDTKEISTNRRGQIVHEVICSECSGIAYFRSKGNKYIGANLCPNCGSDNREVEV